MRRRAAWPLLLLLALMACLAMGQVQITSTSPLPGGYVGISYTYTFMANVQPPSLQGALNWSLQSQPSNPLPSGYELSPNGTLAGTTTQTGTFLFTVVAQAGNFTQSTQFSLTIVQPSIVINSTSPLPNAFLGVSYTDTLSASSNPPGVTWSVFDGFLPPGINLNSSTGVLSGSPTSAGTSTFVLGAQIPNTTVNTSASFTITVYTGQLTIQNKSLPNAVSGQNYTTTLTTNLGEVAWTLSGVLPSGINFNTGTGVLSGSSTAVGIYPLQFTASSPGYPNASATLNLYVTSGPLAIPQPNLPAAVQNSPYTTNVVASGGITPYAFSFVNTSNDGLSISPSGAITGTPTAIGSYLFPVTLSDATGQSIVVNLTLFVATPLTVLTATLPNGNIGTAYSQSLLAGGGTPAFTWLLVPGVGALPPGLSLSTSGVITGTPTTGGSYTFTVQVTDAGKRTASKSLSIAISISAINITTNSLPSGLLGVAYSQTLGVTGGAAPLTWRLASGAFPQGLILDPAKGVISGTPAGQLGLSTFTIQVTDSSSPPLTATKAFTINVALTLTITTLSLPSGTVGTAFPAAQVQASGGTTPYNFTVTSGSLPPGLNLNSNSGAISGTPTASGSTVFTITVTDSGGQTANTQFTISINASTSSLTVTTAGFTVTVGTSVSQGLTATGGAQPYTWSATGLGALGLTVSGSNITGTPTAAGAFSVALTVTDSRKQTANSTITITSNLPPTPPATIGSISGTAASQAPPTLSIGNSFPVDITGTLTAAFQSAVGGSPTEVGFVSSGGGLSPTASFTVPSGATSAVFANAPVLATGTVAGTITLTAKLSAGGVDVTPSPAPTESIPVAAAAPVLETVQFSNTGGGLTVTAIGYSTTREMVSGSFQFYTSSGPILSPVSVPLSAPFVTWFQSSASNQWGGQFSVTIPFTVAGNPAGIVSVNASLANTKGTSNSLQSVTGH